MAHVVIPNAATIVILDRAAVLPLKGLGLCLAVLKPRGPNTPK